MEIKEISNLLEKTSYPKDCYPSYDIGEVIGIISMILFIIILLILIF